MVAIDGLCGELSESQVKKLRAAMNTCEWNPGVRVDGLRGKKDEEQLVMAINHSNISRYLQYLAYSGRQKYNAKAYLWHYQYVDIEAALEALNSTIDQYDLSAHC